jgi:Rhodopirellula transposase DDE domain
MALVTDGSTAKSSLKPLFSIKTCVQHLRRQSIYPIFQRLFWDPYTFRTTLKETAQTLKGHERRRFMAKTVEELGTGGQRLAERELGWHRDLICKGQREVNSGIICVDAFNSRGRKLTESRLPMLLEDIRAIVDRQSQTDPQFRTNRLYTRLSAAQVRVELIAQKGYSSQELPTSETLRKRLNELGFFPSKVGKTKPKKKLP